MNDICRYSGFHVISKCEKKAQWFNKERTQLIEIYVVKWIVVKMWKNVYQMGYLLCLLNYGMHNIYKLNIYFNEVIKLVSQWATSK